MKTSHLPHLSRLAALLLILLATPLSSCDKLLVGPETPNTPEQNFEYLWQTFDRLYGTFKVKHVNWQALHDRYRPQVKPTTSDAELVAIMGQLLDHLDDNHVFIRPLKASGAPNYNGGILGRRKFEDYDQTVAACYLTTRKTYGNDIVYGWLTTKVGYIDLLAFNNNYDYYAKALDTVLGELNDAEGIVVEMRENDGGEDRVAQYIANRFASARHLSFTSRVRNGPRHSDFGPELRFYTEPQGSFQYTKPVVVLQRRATFSSGETFVLAMRQNPNVVTVGDSTGGAFADAVRQELPNGWNIRVPIADVRAADGKNYESIGLAPDYLVKNTKQELASGHDKALETALQLLH
ncbi:S41 family peptidase [Hymenobacter cellulosivorans]|uniref:S41 family peptidase n=1 Tax=Hymenobacter cellulosivorans TaxID=2932249 RepID=A0ABY4F3Z3_9BACT|nr:S41 family peptidase [Hymenobacter cellulosivorans]UOQ51351.1 S41 family peptidase [Hymenobacter cellulosivorans]